MEVSDHVDSDGCVSFPPSAHRLQQIATRVQENYVWIRRQNWMLKEKNTFRKGLESYGLRNKFLLPFQKPFHFSTHYSNDEKDWTGVKNVLKKKKKKSFSFEKPIVYHRWNFLCILTPTFRKKDVLFSFTSAWREQLNLEGQWEVAPTALYRNFTDRKLKICGGNNSNQLDS